jgi:hypothetical protein
LINLSVYFTSSEKQKYGRTYEINTKLQERKNFNIFNKYIYPKNEDIQEPAGRRREYLKHENLT